MAEIDLSQLFPKAQSKPVTIKEACGDIQYLVLGSHGSYKCRINDAALEPSPTLCKSGLPSYKYGIFELGQKPPTPSQLKIKRWGETQKGSNHSVRFSLNRLDWNKPAATIQKTATGSTGTMHPDEPRELYAAELKRIGSYPDDFNFAGKWEEVLARIGNSVPPMLMRAVATQIRHILWGGRT